MPDRPEGGAFSRLICFLTANGNPGVEQEVAGLYEPVEIRRPVICDNDQPSVEFGFIKIPVELTTKGRRSKIKFSLDFIEAFPNLYKSSQPNPIEYFSVDIPYVTRSVRADIIAPDGSKFLRWEDYKFIEAVSIAVGKDRDPDESKIQSQEPHFNYSGTALVWETTSAKLGYRYLLKFGCRRTGPNLSTNAVANPINL